MVEPNLTSSLVSTLTVEFNYQSHHLHVMLVKTAVQLMVTLSQSCFYTELRNLLYTCCRDGASRDNKLPRKTKQKRQRVQKTGGLLFGKNVCRTLPINWKGRSDIYLHSHKPLTWTGRVQVPPTAPVCLKGKAEICTRSNTGENHGWYVSVMRLECVFDMW